MQQTRRSAPSSTYRLQLHPRFTFTDAAARVPYLAQLGVSHVFCSPILQATPGSTHGYDVVDHSRVSEDLGGEEGFRELAEAAHRHGLGVIVDVVPNHMAVPTPLWLNRALWEVLREGSESPFAHWFDIDLTRSQAILMPVLGRRIGQELAEGTITVQTRPIPLPDGTTRQESVVVHHDHVFPVRPGTEDLPVAELLEQQWYRLAYWKVASEELNYRRFFDVDTLAAVRVEDDEVFEATHRTLLDLFREGLIDGFRIDHPDGLANPREYLADLQRATGGCWVVVEKILEGHEALPQDFECAGTTGYDALLRVGGLFHEPANLPRIDELWERTAGSGEGFAPTLLKAKQEVVSTMLFTEVNRLVSIAVAICDGDIRLRDHTRRQLHHAIRAMLLGMDRYRAYAEPGRETTAAQRDVLVAAAERARERLVEDETDTLDLVVALACGDPTPGEAGHGAQTLPRPGHRHVTRELPDTRQSTDDLRAEFMVRFAQACGPVMAKAKEDTAFYRWNRFLAVNEVGSEPTVVGISPDSFHDFCATISATWPETGATLSTHDTKRSADVRARLAAMLELPREWETCVAELRAATEELRGDLVDGATELLVWQTLAATWALPGCAAGEAPISRERLVGYLTKAMREAKSHTTWTEQNEPYEEAILALAAAGQTDGRCVAALDAFTAATRASVRATMLGQKLLQLTMPGVCDVYQGGELVDLSLVDPDNRRPVDFDARAALLSQLEDAPATGLDAETLLVTSRALRLRRDHPDAFRGDGATYSPVATTTGHALAFARGEADAELPTAVTVVTRFPSVLAERGGWAEHQVVLPPARFRDALTGAEFDGGETLLADLLDALPVALLVPITD